MAKESKALLAWRKNKKAGAIMKRTTFDKIKNLAEKKGVSKEGAKKIAGKAYWNVAKAKFNKQK